jgi:beta-lactamase regulating signal transducer with metallopeptidase domain
MSADTVPLLTAATIAVTLALAVVWPVRIALRRAFGAGAAYAAWLAVPCALAAAVVPVPRIVVPAVGATGMSLQDIVAGAVATSLPSASQSSFVFALWLSGCLVSLAVVAVRQLRLDVASKASHGRRVARAAHGPLATGLVAPRIVLPHDFRERYGARERRLIVAHEAAHLRRGDVRINAFAALVRCAFWFHPFVHFAYARFRLDQELACDAIVCARFPEARRCYAGAMLKAQLAGEAPTDRCAPVGCDWRPHHPIEERIQMLQHPLPGRAARRLGLVSAALVAVGVAFGAWAAKPAERGYVDAKLAVRIDDGSAQNVRVIGPLGEPLEVRLGAGADTWRVVLVATDEAPGRLRLASDVWLGETTVGKPQIVMAEGVAGQIVMTTADGSRKIDVEATLVRTDSANPDDQAG